MGEKRKQFFSLFKWVVFKVGWGGKDSGHIPPPLSFPKGDWKGVYGGRGLKVFSPFSKGFFLGSMGSWEIWMFLRGEARWKPLKYAKLLRK